MQTQMYGGDAVAIDTAVAQREWQDGFTRLLSVRVLPDLPFLRPASPDLEMSGPFRPNLAVLSHHLMPCFILRLAASCPAVLPAVSPSRPVYASLRAAGVTKETFHGTEAWQL